MHGGCTLTAHMARAASSSRPRRQVTLGLMSLTGPDAARSSDLGTGMSIRRSYSGKGTGPNHLRIFDRIGGARDKQLWWSSRLERIASEAQSAAAWRSGLVNRGGGGEKSGGVGGSAS